MVNGFNLQLPVYLYLAKNSKLKNIEVLGFYLQPLLSKNIKKDKNKSYLDQRINSLKLVGFTNDKDIELMDKTYQDSNIISGLKTNKDGSIAANKSLSKDKIDKIIKYTETKINETTDNIINNKFDINPKIIKKENKSCELCRYKDICFKTDNDIVKLEESKNLDFLKEV